MPCLVVLLALIGPRVALIGMALFSNVLDRAYDGVFLPLIGFFILPWTTLGYAWMYDNGPGRTVEGWEWIVVGILVLCDLGSLFGGSRSRS